MADDICAPLNAAERAQLHGLLTRIAGHHGLTAGVHPGYRNSDRALTQEEQPPAQPAKKRPAR